LLPPGRGEGALTAKMFVKFKMSFFNTTREQGKFWSKAIY